jgi:hypothetical protein
MSGRIGSAWGNGSTIAAFPSVRTTPMMTAFERSGCALGHVSARLSTVILIPLIPIRPFESALTASQRGLKYRRQPL